jgi:hypothetical protein
MKLQVPRQKSKRLDLELSAVASVPLEIPKGAQCPYFDFLYVPLDRVWCTAES